MKKVRIKFPRDFHTLIPIVNGEIYPIDQSRSFDTGVKGCYYIVLPSGEGYNVYKEWCEPVPSFIIDLPEDLFDL